MSTFTELAKLIAELYPLKDKQAGKRYRIVSELAGLTELEDVSGKARYIPTHALKNGQLWSMVG